MNKFIAMIIFKPDIKEKRITNIQNSVVSLFEQNSKVKRIWYLGKRKLDFKSQKYSEGIYLKLDILIREKKIEQLKQLLNKNKSILSFNIVMDSNSRLFQLKRQNFSFCNDTKNPTTNSISRKVYLLIEKSSALPFSNSNILAISDNEKLLLKLAIEKVYDYIYRRHYKIPFQTVAQLEKELKKTKKIELIFENVSDFKKEILIQEEHLI